MFAEFQGMAILAAIVLVLGIPRWFWKNRKIQATVCGHQTKVEDTVTAFGATLRGKVRVKQGRTEYCHACLGKMAIRCSACGRPVFIGDLITLVLPVEDREMPDYAVAHKESGDGVYIACIRPSCADMGRFDAHGEWIPPGKVRRFPSGTEMAMAAFSQGARAVIIQ